MLLKLINRIFSKEIKREVDERAVAISHIIGGKDRPVTVRPYRLRYVDGQIVRVYELITPEPSAEAAFAELYQMYEQQKAIITWLSGCPPLAHQVQRQKYQLKVLELDLQAACLHLPLDLSKLIPKNVTYGK